MGFETGQDKCGPNGAGWMRRLSLLWILIAAWTADADNLVFNSSFEMGADGFAMERRLRVDTNPALKFIPLATVKDNAAGFGNVLKIANPHGEFSLLSSKEFVLRANTKYRLSGMIKADRSGMGASIRVFTGNMKDWYVFGRGVTISTNWENFEYVFTTKKEDRYFFCQLLFCDYHKGDVFIDNLKVEPIAPADAPGAKIEAAIETDKNLYVYSYNKDDGCDKNAKIKLKLFNRDMNNFSGNVHVTARDEYTGQQLFMCDLKLSIAPHEVQCHDFTIPLSQFGSVRVNASGPGLDSLDGFYSVIGQYQRKKVDVREEFVVAVNGGDHYEVEPRTPYPSYMAHNSELEKRFDIYAKTGIRLLRDHDGGRTAIGWYVLEPEKGKYDFTHLDRSLAWYDKYGITLLPVVGSCDFIEARNPQWPTRHLNLPAWVDKTSTQIKDDAPSVASGFRGRIRVPPLPAWKDYVAAVVKHAQTRIPAYEIINEPSLYLGSELYLKYLKSASETIRSGDPAAMIVGFSMSSDFAARFAVWEEECFQHDGLQYVDAVSFHPYGSRELGSTYPADKGIDEIRLMLDKYHGAEKQLWNTELYYIFDDQESVSQNQCEPHHVAWRFLVDMGEGLAQSISLHDNAIWKRVLTPNMLVGDNFHELIPNENMVAYNALARYFEGAKPVRKIPLPMGTICYVYRKDGVLRAALWNYKDRDGLRADLTGFRAVDIFGNPLPDGNVKLGKAPVYIVGSSYSDAEFIAILGKLAVHPEIPVTASPIVRLVDGMAWLGIRNDFNQPLSVVVTPRFAGYEAGKTSVSLKPEEDHTIKIPITPGGGNLPYSSVEIDLQGKQLAYRVELVKDRVMEAGKKFTFSSDDGKLKVEGDTKVEDGRFMFEFKVNDASPSGAAGSRQPWATDCVELFFDLDPTLLPISTPNAYTKKTFRLFFMPHEQEAKQCLLWSECFKMKDIKYVMKTSPDGYSLQGSFPLDGEKMLGFEVKVDDAEGPDRNASRKAIWADSFQAFKQRCNFGIIRL